MPCKARQSIGTKLTKLLSAVCLTALLATPAAALDHANYAANHDSPEVQAYIQGIGEGYGWAIAFTDPKQPKLFCAPEDDTHTRQEYVALLDDYIAANSKVTEYPVEMILLLALQAKYPC